MEAFTHSRGRRGWRFIGDPTGWASCAAFAAATSWVGGNRARRQAHAQHSKPVPQATRGPPGDGACHDGVVRRIARQRLTVTGIRIRLRAGNEGRAKLRGDRAQTQCRSDVCAVHDAARRDDRSVKLAHEDMNGQRTTECGRYLRAIDSHGMGVL